MAAASTGDLKNNLLKLLREATRMKLPVEPNIKGLCQGIPSAYLPLLHSGLMDYSLPLAQHIASLGIEMYSKTDLKFLDGLYRVMRDVFNYRPQLTRDQFLSVGGYTERKIILTYTVLLYCQKTHESLRPNTTKRSRPLVSGPKSVVHTVADTKGIGDYWQERNQSEHNVPLSPPPPSPSHITVPSIDPRLQVTPLTTPLTTPLKPIINNHQKCNIKQSKEIHFNSVAIKEPHPPQNLESHPLQYTIEPHPLPHIEPHTLHIEPRPPPHIEQGTSTDTLTDNKENIEITSSPHTKGESSESLLLLHEESERVSRDTICLTSICQKMEQLTHIVEQLNGRLILLETQMKLNNKDTKSTSPLSVNNVATQTTPTLETTTPTTKENTPIIEKTTSITNETTPILENSVHDSSTNNILFSSSTPRSHPPPLSSRSLSGHFDQPALFSNFSSPDDTVLIIRNLRDRVQSTKELLNKASTNRLSNNSY